MNREEQSLIEEWIRKQHSSSSHTFVIATRNDEGFKLSPRVSRPCFGEMRRYKEKSTNRKEDRFPGDLLNNFPDGTPVGFGLNFTYNPIKTYTKFKRYFSERNEFLEMMWSDYSPYLGKDLTDKIHKVCVEAQQGTEQQKILKGVVVSTGDFLPSHVVANMMHGRVFQLGKIELYKDLVKHGVDEKVAFRAILLFCKYNDTYMYTAPSTVSSKSDPELYFKGTPSDIDDGLLWSQGCDYNRPGIMTMFEAGRTQIDFRKRFTFEDLVSYLKQFN